MSEIIARDKIALEEYFARTESWEDLGEGIFRGYITGNIYLVPQPIDVWSESFQENKKKLKEEKK